MDLELNPLEFQSLATFILLMLLSTYRALQLSAVQEWDEQNNFEVLRLPDFVATSGADVDSITHAAFYYFRLWNSPGIVDGDLGFWVKPRSTTWFSRFLLDQYDNERWVQMFRFTKAAVFSLANLLRPFIERRNTNYRLAIPVVVRVACTLFKLTHGASLLICSEMFAVGRSSVSMLLRDVVHAINVVLQSEISWPRGDSLAEIEAQFRELCGLPGVVGAIDGTHVLISKPKYGPADYFYFKSGGYSLNCQAVVDSNKRFLDLFLGMPGSTNDSRMLRRSTLYQKGTHSNLWDSWVSFRGFPPYLLGDSGYPLLPWLMVPHRGQRNLPVADALFNKRLRRGRGVVENAFARLKQTFQELLLKCDLHVTFIPDVIICCAILHNLLLRQSHADVERLLDILRSEGLNEEVLPDEVVECIVEDSVSDECAQHLGQTKRRDLGIYLTLQRVQAA